MDGMEETSPTYSSEDLAAKVAELEARLAAVSADNESLARENAALAADAAEAARAAEAMRAERDSAIADRDAALAERDKAVAERDALREEAEVLEARINTLGDQIVVLQRYAFGSKSERLREAAARRKVCPGQMALVFNEVEALAAADADEVEGESDADEAEGAEGEGEAKGRKRTRRPKTPIDFSKWEDFTTVETHDIPEGERFCPQCGAALEEMGHDTVREFKYVPGHIEVTEHQVLKYVCPECSKANQEDGGETKAVIVRAEPPALPLPGTHASASLLAHIIRQKYEFALPVYRIHKDLSQIGLPKSRQTMCKWVNSTWETLLRPLEDEMWRQMRERPVLQMDETTVQVLKEPGRKPQTKSYMWVAVTAEACGPPGVHFEYHPGRHHHIAHDMVGDLACTLVTDGYGAYDEVGDRVVNSRCLYHIRKPFAEIVMALGGLEAAHACGSAAAVAVEIIGELFDLEGEFKGMGPEERARARCERSWPVMLRLVEWAARTREDAVPRSKLANGVTYLIDNVNRMGPWLTDGRVPIDNIRAERAIRPFTVGRNYAHGRAMCSRFPRTANNWPYAHPLGA